MPKKIRINAQKAFRDIDTDWVVINCSADWWKGHTALSVGCGRGQERSERPDCCL